MQVTPHLHCCTRHSTSAAACICDPLCCIGHLLTLAPQGHSFLMHSPIVSLSSLHYSLCWPALWSRGRKRQAEDGGEEPRDLLLQQSNEKEQWPGASPRSTPLMDHQLDCPVSVYPRLETFLALNMLPYLWGFILVLHTKDFRRRLHTLFEHQFPGCKFSVESVDLMKCTCMFMFSKSADLHKLDTWNLKCLWMCHLCSSKMPETLGCQYF